MPRPRKDAHPWTLRVLEILSDGEWHEYDEVVFDAAELVPPGAAWRRAERNRENHYKRAGKEIGERTHGDRNDTVKTGQRMYVAISIRGLRETGRIEAEYGDQAVKKRPTRLRLIRREPNAADM